VKVDSANKHGILLEVFQVLTDLDLIVSKDYISSDGQWFMDVFHIMDQLGNKLIDHRIIDYIQQALGVKQGGSTTEVNTCLGRTIGVQFIEEHIAIELIGIDCLRLLLKISAVFANLKCNVVASKVWTHNVQVACVVYVTDELTSRPIEDLEQLAAICPMFSRGTMIEEVSR